MKLGYCEPNLPVRLLAAYRGTRVNRLVAQVYRRGMKWYEGTSFCVADERGTGVGAEASLVTVSTLGGFWL